MSWFRRTPKKELLPLVGPGGGGDNYSEWWGSCGAWIYDNRSGSAPHLSVKGYYMIFRKRENYTLPSERFALPKQWGMTGEVYRE